MCWCSGFKLTNFDLGNMMHFSFFTIQFFPSTQKIVIPKVFIFYNEEQKQVFLAVKAKKNFNMIHISFSLKQLCCCCLDIRFFSLILIVISFCNSFQLICSFSFCALIYWGLFYNYWILFYICVLLGITLLHPTYTLLLFLVAVDAYLSHWKLLTKHVQC